MSHTNASDAKSAQNTHHITASIKWFDQDKGYGFVATETGNDAFLHANDAGIGTTSGLIPGARLVVDIERGAKGFKVTMVHSVYPPDADSTPSKSHHGNPNKGGGKRAGHNAQPAQTVGVALGVVKWFNAKNGYGFVIPDNQGDDIFVHKSALEKSGIRTPIKEGDRVALVLAVGRNGRLQADKVTLV